MLQRDASQPEVGHGSQCGLIQSRRHAIIALIITFIVLASAFRSAVERVPQHRWLFEPMNHSYVFGKPACITLSIFFWCFVAWILFSFYRNTRDKNERFVVGGFAIGYILGVIGGFLPLTAQFNIELASIAAFLVSFASTLTILKTLSSDSKSL